MTSRSEIELKIVGELPPVMPLPEWAQEDAYTGQRIIEASRPLAEYLALPVCELCGLGFTNGRGEPWPSCRCLLDHQLAGGA